MSIHPSPSADTLPLLPPDSGAHSVDVSALFKPFGITKKIDALFTSSTYEYAPKPEDNWLYPAFRAFQNLKATDKLKWVHTFASVGTGPGLDGVGASFIFHPAHIFLSDENPDVLPIARYNALSNVADKRTQVTVAEGDLCAPLRDAGIRPDLIYANLPLLPADPKTLRTDMRSSTFASSEKCKDVPEIYRQFRLAMMYLFLNDARSSLNENGSVAINLGGRVPVELIRRMFAECGYRYHELLTMLKVQSQPDEVLPQFSKAEQELGIEFDFYRMNEETAGSLASYAELYRLFGKIMNAHQMKEDALKDFRVSATEALELHNRGEQIGHVVQMIEGRPTA
jgi:methylase of polypeptide subunit release factors